MKQSDSFGRLMLQSLEQPSSTSALSRKQFSFHPDNPPSARSTLRLRQIEHTLSHLDPDRLVSLLIQEIQLNEHLRMGLLRVQNSYESAKDEINILTESLAFKKQSYLLLSQNQQKNEAQIRELEQELRMFKKKYNQKEYSERKEGEWQKKYHQLARHMEVYVENNREVQDEFARKRQGLRNEIANVYKNNSELNLVIKELTLNNIGLMEELKNTSLELNEAKSTIHKLSSQKALTESTLLSFKEEIEEFKRLESELRDAKEMAELLKSRCKELEDDCRSSHLQIDSLKSQLTCIEASSKQKDIQDKATTDRQVNQLKADKDRIQLELDCLKMEVGANQPTKAELDELKLENASLKGQLDQAYRMVAQMKAEMVLLQGQADRNRRELKRQTDKNNEIKTELERFCRKRRDTPSPECVLSEIQQNISHSNTKKSPLSSKKVHEFLVDSKQRLLNSSNFSGCKQNILASCIIGEDSREEE